MNIRLQKYKQNRLKGMNQYNAARAAGFSESYSRTRTHKIEESIKIDIENALERAGITEKYQSECIKKLTESEDEHIQVAIWKHISDLKKQTSSRVEHSGLNFQNIVLIRADGGEARV